MQKIASFSKYKLVTVVLLGTILAGGLYAVYQASRPIEQHLTTQAATLSKKKIPHPQPVSVTQDNPLFAMAPSWYQDFSTETSLDPRYWNILVGPAENSNKEQQYYTDNSSNVRIEDGTLRLVATHESQPHGYTYGSARLETIDKVSFLYGRIDISAKIPSGVGTWPAVWLLPANDTYAKRSPATDLFRYRNGGEIDIIEAVGYHPDDIYSVVHTLSDTYIHSDDSGSYSIAKVSASTTTFNTYTLLWTPSQLTFEVNGTPFYTYSRPQEADYKTWPFDQPFYLIANLALGGTWGGMDTEHFPGNGIDNSALPASLDIRSIYYYPYIGTKQ